jgi:purine-nucleoside phosphorylase
VLGSGLGEFADTLHDSVTTPYRVLPHWPASNVAGHDGRLVVGTVAGKRIAALCGRVHLYEGHDIAAVVFATRVMGRVGVKQMILTNAAGGISTALAPGALIIIDDHINMLGANPLVGQVSRRAVPSLRSGLPPISSLRSRLRLAGRVSARASQAL